MSQHAHGGDLLVDRGDRTTVVAAMGEPCTTTIVPTLGWGLCVDCSYSLWPCR